MPVIRHNSILPLKPGEKMEPHKQPFDVVFFVLEGSGILETGNDRSLALKTPVSGWKREQNVSGKIRVKRK